MGENLEKEGGIKVKVGRKQRARPCCEGESGSCEKSNKCSPNHRMPVRALRHVRGVHFHVSFLERSESSNARQGIKTGQMIRRVHIEQNRPNHRMPVRALRRVNDIILVVSILLSESSNARQGIKTEPPRSYP